MLVRRAVPGDESTLRSLRLEALTDAPEAFGSTYAREAARTDTDWRRWIEPNPTFLLVRDMGDACGIVAGARDEVDRAIVHLLAMWVHPSIRRSGGADLLVDAVVSWAREERASATMLWVIEGNKSAIRLYERSGFVFTGRAQLRERDARTELEMQRTH